jgi:predicted nuclease with TOPRIM domain
LKEMSENRVTEEQIEAKIKDKKFTVLEDGKTTICNLYLENGFTVRGESACVDPANFDKELGEKIAYENAKDKIWLLEGYLLQEKLHNQPEDFLDRMELEGKELEERIRKASDGLEALRRKFSVQQAKLKKGEAFEEGEIIISDLAIDLLQAQITAMATYANILLIRVNTERGNRALPLIAQF